MASVIKSIYSFLCDILHWFSPLILAVCVSIFWYSHNLNLENAALGSKLITANYQLESEKKAFSDYRLDKGFQELQAIRAGKAKDDIRDKACEKIKAIRNAASTCQVCQSSEIPVLPVLKQRLPDAVLKELDPSFVP